MTNKGEETSSNNQLCCEKDEAGIWSRGQQLELVASPRKTTVVPSTRELVLPKNLVGIDPNVNKLTEGNCYSFKNLIARNSSILSICQ